LGHAADRLVRDLLDREVLLQQIRSTKEGDFQTVEALQRELAERDRKIELLSKGQGRTEPPSVQSLQKQLAERDRKIEELSTQLEALKRIDQEMREKVRPIRPPSTVSPPLPDTMP
jgi:predicted RNase H-like nuclease (RuvC/YqgF family)